MTEISTFIEIAMDFYAKHKESLEKQEEDIRRRWEETKKMPRKLKKKLRKEILFDYSVLMWEKEMLGDF